ncbi:uncharacterized protein LOC143150513 isoform X2 [Ptiloglossa arizonensis]|uniref:uncharacterized protein LOC143150513 isoform X2 n=1 Tax=Ptiloglossa arizonensis TaxID=3350558 RepID=UPI003F9FF5EB
MCVMSTIAETPTTHNPVQPLFIVCNGAPILDQDDVPVQIKAPPISDEDEDRSVQSDVDSNYGGISSERMEEEDDESDVNDDMYLGEVNYRTIPNKVNDGAISRRVNRYSLPIVISNDSVADEIKEEPIMDTVPTVLVPVRDPISREIRNTYVPVEVKDETGLNIIKSVLIPIKDEDGSLSYEIKKVVVPINPELGLPKKRSKQLQVKFRPIKPKPEKEKVTAPKKLEGRDPRKLENRIEVASGVRSDSPRKEEKTETKIAEEESKIVVPETRTMKDEIDQILENLRNICPLCQKSFNNEKQMDRHIRRKHKNRYRCKKCHFSYASEDALEKHMTAHDKDTYVECPFCHLKYKRMSGLRAHQIRVHSTVDPKSIGELGEEDSLASYNLENQRTNQSGTKTFVCLHCDNVYPQKSYLVAHKRIAHGIHTREPKKFQCNVCSRNFATEDNLRSHTSLHTQSFLCSHCGKELANKYSLQLHTRKHTGERPYKCKVCPKTFAASVALRVHTLTHKGKRPYVCDLCGQRFTQRSSMMAHRRKHPGNHPPPPPVFLGSLDSDGD